MGLIVRLLLSFLFQQAGGGEAPQTTEPQIIEVGPAGADLFEGSSPLCKKVGSVPKGARVRVLEKKSFWALVQPEGSELQGYMPLPREKTTALRPGLTPLLTATPSLTAMATRGLVPKGFGERLAEKKGVKPGALGFLMRPRVSPERLAQFQKQLEEQR
ncbi:MAG: hypothetical protein AB1486_11140 [Planctomycetota bacterium]